MPTDDESGSEEEQDADWTYASMEESTESECTDDNEEKSTADIR